MRQNLLIAAQASTGVGGTTVNSPVFDNHDCAGGSFLIRLTSAQGTTSALTVTIQGLVPGTTGTFYTVLATTPLTAEATHRLQVYPGLSTDANSRANDVLPAKWRVSGAVVGAQTIAWSVGAALNL